jgi:hypothetical protein
MSKPFFLNPWNCLTALGVVSLVACTTLPLLAEPVLVPVSTEQQSTIHRKLTGTWEVTSSLNGQTGTMVFRSGQEVEFATYQSGKLGAFEKAQYQIISSQNVGSSQLIILSFKTRSPLGESQSPVLLEFQGDRQFKLERLDKISANPKFTAAVATARKLSDRTDSTVSVVDNGIIATPEQQAQIEQKLRGTWDWRGSQGIINNSLVVRMIFSSPQKTEGGYYAFGRLSSHWKLKYQILGTRNVNSAELIIVEISIQADTNQRVKPFQIGLKFVSDRQIKLYSLEQYSTTQESASQFSPVFDKISDNTDIVDRIPFKATSNDIAQEEAVHSLRLALVRQEEYRRQNSKYASDFSALKSLEDLRDGNEFYSYRMTTLDAKRVAIAAIPKNKKLYSYSAMLYSQDGKSFDVKICRSNQPRTTALSNPTVRIKRMEVIIQCPRGSTSGSR